MAKVSTKKNRLEEVSALQEGDLVDVIAPGFACAPDVIEKVKIFLESQGFIARIPKDIIEDHPLFSNTDEKRTQMLIAALKAKDSKAIWCLRGGYGCNHLLPALRKLKKQKSKIIIGISDVTSLHGFLIQQWGYSGLHGPLLDRFAKDQVPENVKAELLQVLRGELQEVKFTNLQPLNQAAGKKVKISAPLIGGNLKVIEGHVGTVDEFKFSKKIVFFEEIGERGYRVDRMLFHLSQSGAFKFCKAVVFGSFIGGEEPKADPDAASVSKVDWVLKEWAQAQKFPVFKGLPCGHDKELQRVIPLGTQATLHGTEMRVRTGVKK